MDRVFPTEEDTVAASQEGPQPPAPGAAQPEAEQSSTSGAQQSQDNQAQSPAAMEQEPANSAAQGQPPSGSPLTISQALEQQIANAIQPALDEFRQNMMRAMQQQASAALDASGDGTRQKVPHEPDTQTPAQRQPDQPSPGPPPPSAEGVEEQPLNQIAQQAQSAGQETAQIGVRNVPVAQPEQGGVLRTVLRTVEQQGEQLLLSVIVSALTALLTESTHAAIQQRAEQGLHTLLQKAFQALPEGSSNQEMQEKTERLLQAILRESLDAIFTETMRTTLQQGTQQTIRESLSGDFSSALNNVEDVLKSMAEALIAVLRKRRQSVLRLLLAFGLLALESTLAQSDSEQEAASTGS
jgi:hypothetical protein